MKNLLVILLFSYLAILGQDKGKISLIFNNENIDLPFRSVTISKYDKISVKAQAEFNNDTLHQVIGLELGFNKLAPDEKKGLTMEGTGISINSSKKTSGSSVQFSFWSKDETATYSFSRSGEKITYEINSISMVLDIEKIEYTNNELIIDGNIAAVFKSITEDGKERKQVAEIKDGKFEIRM